MSQIKSAELFEQEQKTQLGFWIYLMTDCVLFGSLFAVYAVLHKNTAGGPGGAQLFSLPYVLGETLLLLTSSFTSGLALLLAQARRRLPTLGLLATTALLGLGFLTMEINEFSKFVSLGDSWRRSGFLSSYFTLVGTHGLHITIGLIWLVILASMIAIRGLTPTTQKRLRLFTMFWHFLDIVWIFIFTIVYVFGVIGI